MEWILVGAAWIASAAVSITGLILTKDIGYAYILGIPLLLTIIALFD